MEKCVPAAKLREGNKRIHNKQRKRRKKRLTAMKRKKLYQTPSKWNERCTQQNELIVFFLLCTGSRFSFSPWIFSIRFHPRVTCVALRKNALFLLPIHTLGVRNSYSQYSMLLLFSYWCWQQIFVHRILSFLVHSLSLSLLLVCIFSMLWVSFHVCFFRQIWKTMLFLYRRGVFCVYSSSLA